MQYNKLNWKFNKLWEGCILATIAHAIMVARYPELSNEHSWDGINYSLQDSAGMRGTITFQNENMCVGAFRNDESTRLQGNFKSAEHYFQGAPEEIITIAKAESLQYLLEIVQGNTIPLITTAFWGIGNEIFSTDSINILLENGGVLLERQMMDFNSSVNSWKEYYEMSNAQVDLLKSIYWRKIVNPYQKIILNFEELKIIEVFDEEGLNASKESFKEIGIGWEC